MVLVVVVLLLLLLVLLPILLLLLLLLPTTTYYYLLLPTYLLPLLLRGTIEGLWEAICKLSEGYSTVFGRSLDFGV